MATQTQSMHFYNHDAVIAFADECVTVNGKFYFDMKHLSLASQIILLRYFLTPGRGEFWSEWAVRVQTARAPREDDRGLDVWLARQEEMATKDVFEQLLQAYTNTMGTLEAELHRSFVKSDIPASMMDHTIKMQEIHADGDWRIDITFVVGDNLNIARADDHAALFLDDEMLCRSDEHILSQLIKLRSFSWDLTASAKLALWFEEWQPSDEPPADVFTWFDSPVEARIPTLDKLDALARMFNQQ